MSIGPGEVGLYAFALLLLFLTPGPVWMAVIARALSGGFPAAWPLALGVAVGDALWPLLAVLGVSWLATEFEALSEILKWVAAAVFIWLGIQVIRHADAAIGRDSRLTRPGRWQGFLAGVIVILANPKAILFYMGMLPGFFDLSGLGAPDIAVIVAVSILVPLLGNFCMAACIGRLRAVLTAPRAIRRLNLGSGAMLVAVGCAIPLL
ncbi:LysE family translocator [Mesobaculum littorinae]|uniref:LysE family translocator n=1 Tax=Mesobaculum littorinae TaxID=2486419 RepID=A0A438AGW2_9RHOB|nr:LysE family translocator [Mesobaculum littorinae]RVV97939.1 LysE family translocator [Mesobaculum littorinae]